jgi:hypothetical protein
LRKQEFHNGSEPDRIPFLFLPEKNRSPGYLKTEQHTVLQDPDAGNDMTGIVKYK